MNSLQRGAAAMAAVLLLGFAATPALAQTPPALRAGQTLTGRLAANDPATTERGRFKLFQFEATEGHRYVLTMRSTDFDALLSVARNVGGITEVLATDDDSGGDTDAQLRFRAPASGQYLVLAQSFSGDGLGAFTLQLENAPQPAPARPLPIQLGQTARGTLTETSPVLDEDDSRYELYTFTGRAGQRVAITMRSQEFDAYLSLLRGAGGQAEELASNDDGAGGTDARIRFTLPADGEYRIHANSLGTDATGAYTLSLEELPPAAAPVARPIRAGQTVSGELTDAAPELDNGSFYDLWSYTARAGERLRISMRSDAFDTYLSIGRMVDGRYEEIAFNDDGPEGTDSLLEVTLSGAGAYSIQARSFFGGQTGPYTLQIEQLRGR